MADARAPVWTIDHAGDGSLPVCDIHIARLERLLLPVKKHVDLVSLRHTKLHWIDQSVRIVTSGQQQVLELSHKHALHQRCNARDGFPLENNRLKLQLHMIRLIETLVIGVISLQDGYIPQPSPVVARETGAQISFQLHFALLKRSVPLRVGYITQPQFPHDCPGVGLLPRFRDDHHGNYTYPYTAT